MGDRRVTTTLLIDDSFAGRMVAAREAAAALRTDLALSQATWEPHDWSDFA